MNTISLCLRAAGRFIRKGRLTYPALMSGLVAVLLATSLAAPAAVESAVLAQVEAPARPPDRVARLLGSDHPEIEWEYDEPFPLLNYEQARWRRVATDPWTVDHPEQLGGSALVAYQGSSIELSAPPPGPLMVQVRVGASEGGVLEWSPWTPTRTFEWPLPPPLDPVPAPTGMERDGPSVDLFSDQTIPPEDYERYEVEIMTPGGDTHELGHNPTAGVGSFRFEGDISAVRWRFRGDEAQGFLRVATDWSDWYDEAIPEFGGVRRVTPPQQRRSQRRRTSMPQGPETSESRSARVRPEYGVIHVALTLRAPSNPAHSFIRSTGVSIDSRR